MDSTSSDYDRQRYFCGYAKVKLHNLKCHPDNTIGFRQLDVENIKRLVRVFETEGCNRLEPEHHIAVKISDEMLMQSLSQTKISQEDLQDPSNPPFLEFGADTQLLCAQGRHRLEACRQFGEYWWVVELYRQGQIQ